MHEDNDAEPRLAFAATPPHDPPGAVLAAAPLPLHCGLYRAGHSVHPIQAKLACCEGSALPVEGDVVGIAEGVLVVTTPHGRLRLRNHETALLRRVLEGSAGRVLVRDRSILGVFGAVTASISSASRRPTTRGRSALHDGPSGARLRYSGATMLRDQPTGEGTRSSCAEAAFRPSAGRPRAGGRSASRRLRCAPLDPVSPPTAGWKAGRS